MKFSKTLMATTALTVAASATAFAQDQEMADSMTLVSWGGAYQNSQQQAYVVPYLEMNPDVSVSWDESSAEAVARLRAMNEAGNITWDLVDVVASDAIRLCDEGLAMEIDHDEMLEAAPDGTEASDDFGDLIVSDCYIPQIVYSTTFGYRTDMVPEGVEAPNDICDVWDLETYPGQRALERRPINNMEWALLCDGVAKDEIYDVLATEEGQDQALAKLDEIKDQVVWWNAGADTPQLLADGEVFMGSTYNLPPLLGDRRAGPAHRHDVGRAGVRPRWLDHSRRSAGRPSGTRDGLRPLRDRHAASGRSGKLHLLRPGAPVLGSAGSGGHEAAHADRSRELGQHVPLQLRVLG